MHFLNIEKYIVDAGYSIRYKSREEVIAFGKKVKKYCKDDWKEEPLHRVFFEWDKWVEENLS